jgi:hypothetical protein
MKNLAVLEMSVNLWLMDDAGKRKRSGGVKRWQKTGLGLK